MHFDDAIYRPFFHPREVIRIGVISKRCISIDIIRGLAVFLMVAVHMALLINMGQIARFGIFIIPFFLMVSGSSCELFLISRFTKGYRKQKVFLEVLCRAFILYIISILGLYFGHIFLPGIYPKFYFFIWSFFQLVAIGYILSLILPKDTKIRILLITLIFIFTLYVENYNSFYLQFLITGDRPPLPYIAYFWFGQIAYQIISNNLYSIKLDRYSFKYIFCSIIYLIICVVTCYIFNIDINIENPNKVLAFMLTSSVYLSIIIILINIIDFKYRNNRIICLIERPGRIAFTIYYIHMPIIYFIIYPFLLLFPFLNKPPFSTTILILFFLVMALFEIKWRKYNYLFGIEWILREGTKLLFDFALRFGFQYRSK